MVGVRSRSRIYANSVIDLIYRKGPLSTRTDVGETDSEIIHDILATYDDSVVFVHAGLSDIKQAFKENPYFFLLETLEEHFESILTPGYTPQFKETGMYDKRNTEPAYGSWSKLFLQDAEYRTNDAIHSILVRGDYRFEGCNHNDTFADDGCFAKIDRDNILILNIGVPWLMTTQHHYIERQYDAPYQTYPTYEGIIIDENGNRSSVSQRNETYTVYARRAWRKLQRESVEAGVVNEFNINGLLMLLFRANTYRDFLEDKVTSDPYYLVSI